MGVHPEAEAKHGAGSGGGSSRFHPPAGRTLMTDVLYLVLIAALFAAGIAYTKWCGRI